jgi:hypothetical protein
MISKQLIVIGTVAFMLSIGSIVQSDKANAGGTDVRAQPKCANLLMQAELHRMLGLESDQQLHDALYDGKTLADIAAENGQDVSPVIELQIDQLSVQLEQRLAKGSITVEQYDSHLAELREIVTNSIYGTASASAPS